MNRRKFLIGSATAALLTQPLPSHATPFQPLYTRLSNNPDSFLYNMPSAIFMKDENNIRKYFGCYKNENGETCYAWEPYETKNVSLNAYLPQSTSPQQIKFNEIQYKLSGMLPHEMPIKMQNSHFRIIADNDREFK